MMMSIVSVLSAPIPLPFEPFWSLAPVAVMVLAPLVAAVIGLRAAWSRPCPAARTGEVAGACTVPRHEERLAA